MSSIDLEDFDSDELICELEDRGYYVYEDEMETEEDMEERIEGEVEYRYKNDYFVLPKFFQRLQLRDFLCEIVECGTTTVSDDELLKKLKDKITW